jgi:hypothetical protein
MSDYTEFLEKRIIELEMTQAAPIGSVLVPVEPTEAMIDAIQVVIEARYNQANAAEKYQARHAYSAMLSAAIAPAKCKCSMTISVLGDGCSVCNPEYMAEMLADQAEDEKEDAIAGLVEALENVLKVTRGSSGRIILDQHDEQDLRDVLAAHRQQEGK